MDNAYTYDSLCDCFKKDKKFSAVHSINPTVQVAKLENPNAVGYPEVAFMLLELQLNYCPQCGKSIILNNSENQGG